MTTRIVVPAYNEERRLPVAEFAAFLRATDDIEFVFVDDGSTDATAEVVLQLVEQWPDRVALIAMPRNSGKAEAVRTGLVHAATTVPAPERVGYFDADLATPLRAIPEMVALFDEAPHLDIVMASRVQLLGRAIERNAARHYAGRVFATFASMLLEMPVYDTQCGAKLFRVTESLIEALAEPFVAGWVFDVELLRRLQLTRRAHGELPVEEATFEFPLERWRDVKGSKVRPTDFPKAIVELARIYARYGRGG